METRADVLPPYGNFPLSERRKLEFAYDGQGRRVAKKVSNWNGSGWTLVASTLYLYDGWNLLADLNALKNNAVACSYVWGLDLSGSMQGAGGVGGLLFSTFSAQSSTHAAAYDGNGNVIALVDMATGNKSATYEYSAFGETVVSDGVASVVNPFRFSTKYTDNETGLLYYGLRYYNPGTGRWLSRDPIAEGDGPNIYAFLKNSPIKAYDMIGLWGPSGHRLIAADWLTGREVVKLGCCEVNVLQAIQDGAQSVDGGFDSSGLSAQASANSYQHAMRSPDQDPRQAEALYTSFINANEQAALSEARLAKQRKDSTACSYLRTALFYLGMATHPFEDSFSPAHRGFQIWFGPVDGLIVFGPMGYKDYVQRHHNQETDDKIPVSEITRALQIRFGATLNEILKP